MQWQVLKPLVGVGRFMPTMCMANVMATIFVNKCCVIYGKITFSSDLTMFFGMAKGCLQFTLISLFEKKFNLVQLLSYGCSSEHGYFASPGNMFIQT